MELNFNMELNDIQTLSKFLPTKQNPVCALIYPIGCVASS
jgi:hypothetical protein